MLQAIYFGGVWLAMGLYVLDHLLFALRVARTTYLKKIAVDPADITPTSTLAVVGPSSP